MAIKFSNNATTTLASGVSAAATTLAVYSGTGSRFPVIAAGEYFYLTVTNIGTSASEIVKVTARSGDFLTVERGQDGTTALALNSGDRIELRLTAAALDAKLDKDGTMAMSGPLTLPGNPTNNLHAAPKQYVDNAITSYFASGTRLMFAQAAAPTGWTQVTTDEATNRMLRVVNTAGAGTGGSHSPILNNVVPSHTHGFTTGTESVDHSHSGNTGTVSADHVHSIGVSGADDNNHTGNGNMVADSDAGYTGTRTTNGISTNHTHGFTTGGRSAAHTHSGTTDNGSSQTNWTPRYIDMILCAKA